MRTIYTILLSCYFVTLFAQSQYQIKTLDSVVSSTSGQGVYALTAAVNNDQIHLTYIHGDKDQKWHLIYEVRNDGHQIFREIIHDFPAVVWTDANTSIQFDHNGNPNIYCAYVTESETRMTIFSRSDEWNKVEIDYKAISTWLHSSSDGQNGLGFVTLKRGNEHNDFKPIINYYNQSEEGWIQTTISSSPFFKTQPAAYHHGEDTYVAYVEAHPPDTTILFIHKKNENEWTLDARHVYPEGGYTFGSIAGHLQWNKFGSYNGQVHLMHNLNQATGSAALTHVIKNGSSWEEVDIKNRESYAGVLFSGKKIEFDGDGNCYWVDGGTAVRWISADQIYYRFSPPMQGHYFGYFDFVVKGDEIYFYIIAGDKNYPFGDPVTFYEARGPLSALTGVQTVESEVFEQASLFPNPGKGKYNIHIKLKKPALVSIDCVDINGKFLSKSKKIYLSNTETMVPWNHADLAQGMYIMQISTAKENVYIPFINQ